MKKLVLITILLGFTVMTEAQVSLQANYKAFFSAYPTFEKFRTSFNEYQKQAGIYKEDLKKFGFMNSSEYVASFFWEGIYADCGYGHIQDVTRLEYLSGAGREYKLEINQFIFTGGYGQNYDRGGYCVYIGIESGVLRLRSTYFYPDGSPSRGLEKASNRAYEALPAKFSLGVKAFLPLSERVDIVVDAGYLSGGMKTGYDDLLDDNPVLTDRLELRNLPDDYVDYYDGGEYSGAYVQGDLKGFRIGLGLKIDLFNVEF